MQQSLFARLFPIPSFFTLQSVGLDFSDTTLRFMKLVQTVHGIMPKQYAQVPIPEGCVVGGRIMDEARFSAFLADIQKTNRLTNVRVAIPESQVYSVTLSFDRGAEDTLRNSIELVLEDNIPLRLEDAVFDYQVLVKTDTAISVQVVAVSKGTAESFLRVFSQAGMTVVSFEVDSQAIARALIAPDTPGAVLIVDIGAERTGLSIVVARTAVYTTTLEFGGIALIDTLMKELAIDRAEAHRILHEGISPSHREVFAVLAGALSVLRDEIDRRFIYWHDRKEERAILPGIERVYLCGGYGTIDGLAEYLTASLHLRVEQSNPWVRCLSFDRAIPPLVHDEAQSYVTAIGLALAEYHYD